MNEEIINFELNNWFAGRDYPMAEPFLSWMKNDFRIVFRNEDWVKANELVVVYFPLDMSQNFLISAKRSWVEANCPELLTKFTSFIRKPDADGISYSYYGPEFLEYSVENIGIHEIDDPEEY